MTLPFDGAVIQAHAHKVALHILQLQIGFEQLQMGTLLLSRDALVIDAHQQNKRRQTNTRTRASMNFVVELGTQRVVVR